MADRWFNQFRFSLEKKVVDIFAKVDLSASATPVLITAQSKGVASIGYTATGTYTFTLVDKYNRLLNAAAVIKQIDTTVINVSYISVSSETISTGGKVIVLQTWVPATTTQAKGLLTTGTAGAQMWVTFQLSNSSVV